jgi:hypothetical protein
VSVTRDELIKHLDGCIERAEESMSESEHGTYHYAYADGYIDASKYILEKLKLEVNE